VQSGFYSFQFFEL